MPAVRKQPWSNKSQRGIVKGKVLSPSAAIEQRYYTELRILIERMITETEYEIKSLFKTEHAEEFFAQDASVSSQARILTNALIKKFTDLFASYAKPMAERFADESDKSSDLAVKSSIRQLSDKLTLSTKTITSGPLADILNATVTENVALIKSIPAQYLGGVQQAVMRSITTGRGMQDLVPYLQKHKGITIRRARMIASDQSRKTYANLSKARMEKAGIKEYIWRHTSGSRHPRHLHIELDGTVQRYDDPPVIQKDPLVRGHPGQLINCFTGSTKVSLSNGCINLWRYLYSGNIITISIANGEIVECTPNHPIMTLRGWLPANEIQEGDYLISSQAYHAGGIDDKHANRLTTFDDLFASLVKTQSCESHLAAKFNFHGDIPEHEVNTISVDHILPTWRESANGEQLEQFILSFANLRGDDFIARLNTEVFELSGASGFRKCDAILAGEPRHSDNIGLASITNDNAILNKNLGDNLPRNVESRSQIENAIPRSISIDDSLGIRVSSGQSVQPRKDIIHPFSKILSDPHRMAAGFSSEVSSCHSIVKTFLRVKKKSVRVSATCHVYTIQSVNGWYTVTPTEIIVKNCACRMQPILKFS